MKPNRFWNRLLNREGKANFITNTVVIHKEDSKYRVVHDSSKKIGSILLYFVVLLIFCGCSKYQGRRQGVPTVNAVQKSLLEQAVDWGNEYIFDASMSYDSFTIEEKVMNQTNYQFLVMNESNNWESELFYIVLEEDTSVQKLIPCGGGNKELFSFELVQLSEHTYVAVESASHMGNGGLALYPIDDPAGSSYYIENVIDNHYEIIPVEDDNGNEYMKSEIFEGGKLFSDYQDKNGDGYTDISFTGTKLLYEDKTGEESNLTLKERSSCSRTYYYSEEMDGFILGDESEEIVEAES